MSEPSTTPVIDAHQHFWSLKGLGMGSAFTETPILDRDYLPEHLSPQLQSLSIDHTIYVAGFPDTPAARKWEFELATQTDFVAGITSWIDLCDPQNAGARLDEMKLHPKFVGIRHLVELEPDPDWLAQQTVFDSLKEIANHGVCYDMLVREIHFKHVLNILDRIPDLRIVIDHSAKPDAKAGLCDRWVEGMKNIASHPQAYCKLSGFVTEADHEHWTPDQFAPFIETVVELFGWDRIMFGSDWPVCQLAASYQQVWDVMQANLTGITPEQRDRLYGLNAAAFYQLELP